MVLCLLALPVFAILSIFSIKYRQLTLDALDCLFRAVTLRKCTSGLDDRIKSDITGRMLNLSPIVAGFFYKHYRIISWIIFIILLWSVYTSSVGVYNYINYGNCNGPSSSGFCVFDPTGDNSKMSEVDITVKPDEIIYPVLENDDPIIGPKDAKLTIIEFGCYACPYTKKAEPIVQQVIDYYDGKVNFQFKNFYIPIHNQSNNAALAADCALEQDKYMEFHNALFSSQSSSSQTYESFIEIGESLSMNITQFKECYTTEKYKQEIDSDTLMGIHAGVPGTPTFFVGKQMIVGPKPFKTFKKLINEELERMEEES